jgi:23S rRNA (guanosine2251-2'-O)-methyltransferase
MARNFMLLYGKKSVGERLLVNPGSVRRVFLQDGTEALHIERLVCKYNISLERLPARKIENMKRARNVQGVIARVDKFEYIPYEELLSLPGQEKRSLVFLDRINDPQNFGVIIRSLACFGGFAVVIPESGACMVTEAVLHVACGGENYLRIAKVPDLGDALIAAKKQGYWIMGAIVNDGENVNSVSLQFPLGLVLGSEAKGIFLELEQYLDTKVYIPMPGVGLSLNVGMACTVFAHEINRRKGARD